MHSALAIAFAALASASPIVKGRQASAINDGVILNYALSLEHLENTFYREALAKFSEADFAAAGLPASFYHNLMTIAGDEKTHVEFLTTALSAAGVTPVQECTYAFGTDDVPTFLAVANVLEGVGVSAYLGAAASIADKAYLTAAGSILTVESRHSAYLRENQSPAQSPFPFPFDIPLNFNQVFSLAAQFITACPQGDDGTLGLPFMPFPALAASPAGVAKPGDKIDLKAAMSVSAMGAYFITSTGSLAAPLTGSGDTYSITVPEGAQTGQAYLVLTKDMNAPTDDNVVAGPAVIQIADAAAGKDYDNGGGMPDGGMPDGGKPDGGKPDGGKPEDYGSYGKYGNYGDYKDVGKYGSYGDYKDVHY